MLLCRQLDLFGRELLAVDGTRIKAVNNKDRNFTRASLAKFIEVADAKLDDYLQRLDQSDVTENGTAGSRVKDLAEKIAAIRKRRTSSPRRNARPAASNACSASGAASRSARSSLHALRLTRSVLHAMPFADEAVHRSTGARDLRSLP